MKPVTAEARLREQVGKRVKHLRQKAELTQTQLAARAGHDQATISRVETGDYKGLTPAILIDLAWGLGCQPDELFEWPIGIMDLANLDPGRTRLERAVA